MLSSSRLGDRKSDNEGSHTEMTTKTQNREEKNHPECRPEEKEVRLRRLTAWRGGEILFSTFQTEETGAVGVAGELASKIFSVVQTLFLFPQ